MPVETLNPAGAGTYNHQPVTGAATAWQAWSDSSDASYTEAAVALGPNSTSVTLDALPSGVTAITQVVVYVRVNLSVGTPTSATNYYVLLENGSGSEMRTLNYPDITNSIATVAAVFTTAPGGGAWAAGDFTGLELRLHNDTPGGDEHRTYKAYVEVWHIAGAEGEDPAREVLSRYIREQSGPRGLMTVPAGLKWLDKEIGDFIDVSDLDGESADEAGWGFEGWERRVHELQAVTYDMDAERVDLVLQDVKFRMVLFYDSGMSSVAGALDYPGVIRLDTGSERTFARASVAWVEDFSDGVIKQVPLDVEALGVNGETIERESTCWFKRCGFRSYDFAITKNGTGSNGSAIGIITADTWLDTQRSPGSLGFIASSTPGVDPDLEAVWPVTATIPASTVGAIMFRHRDDTADPLYYWLQRAVDSKYWRASDSTWQAAKTWNAIPVSETKVRYVTDPIAIGGSDTTLTLGVGLPAASAVASQYNLLYKVQGESVPWIGSDIVCDETALTREVADLSVTNDSGERTFPASQGSWAVRYTPYFDSADVSGYTFPLFHVTYDANNKQTLYYDGTNQRFVLYRLAAGVAYNAYLSVVLTRDTPVDIVARWTGTDGALDQGDYSLSIVSGPPATGTVGTAVASAAISEDAAATFYLGSDGGGNYADGALAFMTAYYFPLLDAEAKRQPL
jgi:hypothetical protein